MMKRTTYLLPSYIYTPQQLVFAVPALSCLWIARSTRVLLINTVTSQVTLLCACANSTLALLHVLVRQQVLLLLLWWQQHQPNWRRAPVLSRANVSLPFLRPVTIAKVGQDAVGDLASGLPASDRYR